MVIVFSSHPRVFGTVDGGGVLHQSIAQQVKERRGLGLPWDRAQGEGDDTRMRKETYRCGRE
jgi:hypothetical protein